MDTKESIIRTAEVLFARNGYSGTSLRDITETAGVNVASVNYHFGSKEKLLIEILDRIVVPMNEERLGLLDEVEARTGTPTVTDVLTAFLLPDLRTIDRLRSRDRSLPRFVSRMYTEGSELMGQIMGRQFAETQERFYSALAAALPHLSIDEISWRMHCVVGIIIYLFAGVEAPTMPPMLGDDIDRNLQRLLQVTVPLVSAPLEEVVPPR